MTEVEPEFDVNERDSWYALAEYEAALCPQCGQLRSICSDPATVFHPRLHTCFLTSAQQMHERRWRRKYEKTEPDRDGWLPTDGSFVWVSDDPGEPDENPFSGDDDPLSALPSQ
ncbi:hypothetical protein [Aeromicrobium sp. 9AM]|uniref:hypothetical protein n=1 Tax=Aeromicrobium sp. 9AM TaxID=2653126 RepID=UPI0012F3F73E|nr:hypothetical protein [Aeromicrobium sp. 9AM]VXC08880.1 hypothetical protein AERO9AM_50016 [Aeromicrobium sp. 9AM]